MKVNQQPAYVLHGRPWSESSLLLDLFSRDHGRLAVIAKGARRGKTRARGVLLPFRPLLVGWSGKGQLPTLTGAESGVYRGELRGQCLASGYYLNELLLKLLHRYDPHESLYDRYESALVGLSRGEPPHRVLRVFEKNLLQEIGFGLVLEQEAESGEPIEPRQKYHYVPELGPVCRESGGRYTTVISGETLLSIREETLDNERVLTETRALTRSLIDRQLQGRTLRSRRVMLEVNRYRTREGGESTD